MAFLTCEANTLVGDVHPKAMPVVLRHDHVDRWLNHERESACELAQPYTDDLMRRFDRDEAIDRIEPNESTFTIPGQRRIVATSNRRER